MRAWTQYWLIAVSSAVRTSLSNAMTCESPFMGSPLRENELPRAAQRGWEASAPMAERQSELPRRGQEEQESSIRCAIASRQAPQSVPAPQQAATAPTLLAPAR